MTKEAADRSVDAGHWPRGPTDRRLYAVGDIHGRADLLADLLSRIAKDAAAAPDDRVPWLITLGDYVDRGPDSRGVLDLLTGPPPVPDMRRVHLKGNHEDMMLRALRADRRPEGPDIIAMWMENGGADTLRSYGVDAPTDLAAAVPPAHRRFLEGLDLLHVVGDYAFVHAGIEPGVALDRQSPLSLMWIREPFLSSSAAHGPMIVHGHTIHAAPVLRANRIGIDTGAYASGCLTCLVIEGAARRFLRTA